MKYASVKTQTFGVEVEMTNISRPHAQEVVAKVLVDNGHGPVRKGYRRSYDNHYVIDKNGREWKCESDSSITVIGEGSCEFVTPICKYEDLELVQNIIRALKAAGAQSHSSCGIHIHVGAQPHTAASLRRLVNFFVGRQDLFYEALEIGDRANRWCRKINKNLLIKMKAEKDSLTKDKVESIWYSKANDDYSGGINHSHYNPTRYHGLNLHAVFTKGTIEFRLFNSTLHAGKIKAYIQFCLGMSAWALESNENPTFRKSTNLTAEQKLTLMNSVLTHRLGLTGLEFGSCRLHILAALKKQADMVAGEAA